MCEIDEVPVSWVFQVGQISRDRLYRVRLAGNWYERLAYPVDQRERLLFGEELTLWKLWKQTRLPLATSHDVSTSIFFEKGSYHDVSYPVIPTESLDSQFRPTSQVPWWGSGAHDSNSSTKQFLRWCSSSAIHEDILVRHDVGCDRCQLRSTGFII